ncbi:MAG: GDSL-type esterase/lipase family protein [Candidatus Omnitrophica bacterium]|nr:GDSL-type esterase/lipase family protein [Candidatus Omnitrophota bacterium]
MRKIKIPSIVLGVSLLGLMILHAGCVRSDIANLESRGKNIVCFGDSITRGKGVNPSESYPAALAKMTSVPIVNAGINGDITPEALKRVKTDVLDNDPFLVVIEFGGNDYLNKVPLEETIKNIEEMIKIIQAQGVMVAIVDISNILFMEEYRQEFQRLSHKYRTIFIPRILDDIVSDESLKSDAIHPNAKGYKIIAYRVYRGIIPYINLNTIRRGLQKKIFDSSKIFR